MLAGGHPLGAAQLRGGNARLLTLRLRRVTASRVACSAASTPLRPYTLRKGDTLESIASKRGLTIAEMQSYNKDLMSPGRTEPGKTILLPAFKLSEARRHKPRSFGPLTRNRRPQRDREILKGIAPVGPRLYPLRKGETVADVLAGRGVTLAEAKELNPSLNLARVKEGTVLRLPYGRYTTREKEMLSSVAPSSMLGLSKLTAPSTATLQTGGAVLLFIAAYAFYLRLTKAWSENQ